MDNTSIAGNSIDVLVIGDVMMDHQYWVDKMPKSGDDVEILSSASNSGGSAANTAIALQTQGVACAFCGRFGKDEYGTAIIKQMKEIGLDLSCIQYGGKTGYTITVIDAQGERTMFSYRGACDYQPTVTNELLDAVQKAKLLFLSGYMLLDKQQAEFVIEAAKHAKSRGCYVMLDASPAIGQAGSELVSDLLSLTDVILPNRLELEILSKTDEMQLGLERLHRYVPCIALKLGGKGSMLSIDEGFRLPDGSVVDTRQEYFAEAEQVTVIDTTGAGDSFNAGFAASFLCNEPPAAWIKSGNALAGRVIGRRGGGF